MSARVDITGILERAGADANAPEGSQAWALAQMGDAVAELIEKANACALSLTPADDSHNDGLYVVRARYVHELRAALARVGGGK